MDKESDARLPRETQWVIKIVDSCETPLQMELCENLIKNYQKKFQDTHIAFIDEAFRFRALKTGYDQHKKVKHVEKHPLFIKPKDH